MSSSNVLTDLVDAQITDTDATIDGKVLSRPTLLVTDGAALTYAVDVDIGKNQILRNVPVANNNRALIYADAGAAVTLTRTSSGMYRVTGLSNEMPGTYTYFTVDLGTFTFGAVEDRSIAARVLTYGELATYGVFGIVPYGAIGVFKGGVLEEINA